jgi:hypothetical protein
MSLKTFILQFSDDCSNTDTALFVSLVEAVAVAQPTTRGVKRYQIKENGMGGSRSPHVERRIHAILVG